MKSNMNHIQDKPDRSIPDITRTSFAFTIWLGALIRYILYFGSISFIHIYSTKSDNKNMFIGYLAIITAVTIAMTMLIFL